MPSRGGSWRSRATVCAGTYHERGRYVSVSVRERNASCFLVIEEFARRPGVVEHSQLIGWGADLPRVLRDAEAHVLARGGLVGAEPEAIGGSPVGETLCRAMFTEIGLRRFVHVPAGPRAR